MTARDYNPAGDAARAITGICPPFTPVPLVLRVTAANACGIPLGEGTEGVLHVGPGTVVTRELVSELLHGRCIPPMGDAARRARVADELQARIDNALGVPDGLIRNDELDLQAVADFKDDLHDRIHRQRIDIAERTGILPGLIENSSFDDGGDHWLVDDDGAQAKRAQSEREAMRDALKGGIGVMRIDPREIDPRDFKLAEIDTLRQRLHQQRLDYAKRTGIMPGLTCGGVEIEPARVVDINQALRDAIERPMTSNMHHLAVEHACRAAASTLHGLGYAWNGREWVTP